MNLDSVGALPEANGLVFTGQKADFAGGDPVTRRFAEDFRKANGGREPSVPSMNYYNATLLFGLLARQVEAEGGRVDGDSLRAALLKTRRFPLAGGVGEFDEQGNMAAPMEVIEWRDGQRRRLAG